MTKKNIFLAVIAAALILESFLLLGPKFSGTSDSNYTKAYQQNNRIFSILLPSTLEFAGEPVPLNLYYVRESLDREISVNTYWQSSTLIMLKKTNRYFRLMSPILKKYNIPDDFKYLALIESGLTNVVSPAGASGFWQIIPETGKRFGLEITEEVDERYNLEKSTEAACRLLNHSYSLFKNWTLAAAAYNVGEAKIQKEIANQKTNSYYDLYLNQETSRYVFRILALKMLYEHPTEFGYYIREKDLYPPLPTYQVLVDSSIPDLISFSKSHNLSYRVLKDFNPWLRKDKLTVPKGRQYALILPKEGFEDYNKLIEQLENAEQIFNDTLTAGKLFN
jgi:hypothetical protein